MSLILPILSFDLMSRIVNCPLDLLFVSFWVIVQGNRHVVVLIQLVKNYISLIMLCFLEHIPFFLILGVFIIWLSLILFALLCSFLILLLSHPLFYIHLLLLQIIILVGLPLIILHILYFGSQYTNCLFPPMVVFLLLKTATSSHHFPMCTYKFSKL